MLNTLTNINCEMKSMAVYSASFATSSQFSADTNESSFSTAICQWGFENQPLIIESRDSGNNIRLEYHSRWWKIGPRLCWWWNMPSTEWKSEWARIWIHLSSDLLSWVVFASICQIAGNRNLWQAAQLWFEMNGIQTEPTIQNGCEHYAYEFKY